MKLSMCMLVMMVELGTAQAGTSTVRKFTIQVNGASADGIFVEPSGSVRRLIVVTHGYSHTTDSWEVHIAKMSAQNDALVVAMNYPDTFEGTADGGAETVAAVHHFKAKYPQIEETYLFSVSMGNIPAAIVLTEHNLIDWWVSVEGISNLAETWAEAKALQHKAAPDIEKECGGTPADAPTAYTRRSVALRVGELAGKRLRGTIVIHAPADGLVPYDQSRELAMQLSAAKRDVDFYSVVGRDCRVNSEGNHTPLGYAGQNPECLAGHARESLSDHVVMKTGFRVLASLVSRQRVPSGSTEFTVDEPYAPGE